MSKNLRLGNVIFCEYVARGEAGKFVIVNNYAGDILTPVFPANIVGAVYLEFHPGNQSNLRARLEFFQGENKIFESVTLFAETKSSEPAIIFSPPFGMTLDQPTTIRAKLSVDGFRGVALFSKEIRLNPLPTAWPQPS